MGEEKSKFKYIGDLLYVCQKKTFHIRPRRRSCAPQGMSECTWKLEFVETFLGVFDLSLFLASGTDHVVDCSFVIYVYAHIFIFIYVKVYSLYICPWPSHIIPFKQTYKSRGIDHDRREETIQETLQNAFFFKSLQRKIKKRYFPSSAFCKFFSFWRWTLFTWFGRKEWYIDFWFLFLKKRMILTFDFYFWRKE